MTPIRDGDRAERQDHLVRREGVSPSDASDFLDVLDLLEEADPTFHAAMASELDGRILRARSDDAVRARAALDRLAAIRDTRAGPVDVRNAIGIASRAAGHA